MHDQKLPHKYRQIPKARSFIAVSGRLCICAYFCICHIRFSRPKVCARSCYHYYNRPVDAMFLLRSKALSPVVLVPQS